MISSGTFGLQRRAGTSLVGGMGGVNASNSFIHHYTNGGEEYYVVLEEGEGVRIYDENCVEQNVTNTALDYNSVGAPIVSENLKALTVADTTILYDTSQVVDQLNTIETVGDQRAFGWVQFTNYGRTYSITVRDVDAGNNVTITTVTHTTPEATAANAETDARPANVAAELAAALNADVPFANNCIAHATDGVIQITNNSNGKDILVTTEDDGGQGKDFIAINGQVKTISDLPPHGVISGVIIKVVETNARDDLGFYLISNSDNGGITGNCTWEETDALYLAADSPIDVLTMPYTITRTGFDGGGLANFTVNNASWDQRESGDFDSNPLPDFVGKTIQSMGIFQDRLYILAGDTLSLSRSADYFDFFRNSVVAVASDDPISLTADTVSSDTLLHSVIHEGDLIIFSRGAQLKLGGDVIQTAETATLVSTTAFDSSPVAPPVSAGDSIFFAIDEGDFSSIREFFTDSDLDTRKARPITEHVPRYIGGAVKEMVTSPNDDLMLVTTSTTTNEVYVYKWHWAGKEKAISAWCTYEFPSDWVIEKLVMTGNTVTIIALIGTTHSHMFRMELGDPAEFVNGSDHVPVRLDAKDTFTFTATDTGHSTTGANDDLGGADDCLAIITGYSVNAGASAGDYDYLVGIPLEYTYSAGEFHSTELPDVLADLTVIIGRKYVSSYTPSKPIIKDHKDLPITLDKVLHSQFIVNYDKAETMTASLTDINGNTKEQFFTTRTFGGLQPVWGYIPQKAGSFKMGVGRKAGDMQIQIKTDDHLDLQIRDIEIIGRFTQSTRRI
jgi:hypothetical protein